MRMPARGEERPERARTIKAPQVSEARRIGPPGQMREVAAGVQAVGAGEHRMRRMRKHAMGSERAACAV